VKLFGNVLMRIVATFSAAVLGTIGAGAIVGANPYLSACIGGLLAVAKVVERLSIAFLEDGKLDADEINAAFAQAVVLKDTKKDAK
jgi:poly-gamma-glutamate capsule biosynthesis protein CapA/YwtB (metallophosphatase superfamily)